MARRAAHTRTGPDGRPVHVRAHDVRTRRTGPESDAALHDTLAAQATQLVDDHRMEPARQRADEASAALQQAQADLEHETERFATETAHHETARQQSQPLRDRANAAHEHYKDVSLRHQNAVLRCKQAIVRLYTEAGLPPGLAPYLADDTIKGHTRPLNPFRPDPDSQDTITRVGQLKTNKRGPKAAPTQAANEARLTDPEFLDCQTQLNETADLKTAAYRARAEAFKADDRARAEAPPAPSHEPVDAATARYVEAEATYERAQKAVAAGLPGEPARLSELAVDDIVRTDNGLLNVHVWGPVDHSTREHDWIPCTNVHVDYLGSRLEDIHGTLHSAGEHYAGLRNPTVRRDVHVIIDRTMTGEQPWVDAVDQGATGGIRAMRHDTDSTG